MWTFNKLNSGEPIKYYLKIVFQDKLDLTTRYTIFKGETQTKSMSVADLHNF